MLKPKILARLLYRKFKGLLRQLDMFGEPISLRLFQQKKFSTSFGGFLSIFLIIVLLILTQSKFSAFYSRSSAYVTRYEKIDPIPPKIDINNRFAISVGPLIMNSLTGKRYFDFFVKLSKYEYFTNGSYIYSGQDILLTPCKANNFPMLNEDYLRKNGFDSWICPDIDFQNFFIEGAYSQNSYSYISIYVAECSSNNNNKNNSFCAEKEEIEKIKKDGGGKIYVNIKLINNLVNLENYETPYSPYIDGISFLINTNDLFVQKELFLNEFNIITDNTMSFNFFRNEENYHYDSIFTFNRIVDTYTVNENNIFNSQKYYTAIFIRSSQLSYVCRRKYDSFQDYLQTLGALYSIFYIFFKFICLIFTKDYLIEKIANSLYIFPHHDKHQYQIDKLESVNISNCSINKFQKFRNSLWSKIKEYIYDKRYLGYKILEINKTVINDMDLIQLLKRIKEIENLKKVFLSREQKIVFEYASKPNFMKNKKISIKSLAKLSIVKENNKKNLDLSNKIIDNLSNAYMKLNNDKNKMNSKILSLLDRDIRLEINKHQNKSCSNSPKNRKDKEKINFSQKIKCLTNF